MESSVNARGGLDAVDLLAIASRAAASVANEQAEALAAAVRAFDVVVRNTGCIWVVGDAADAHARRLGAAGHPALVWIDAERLPQRLGPFDLLLACVFADAPLALLGEARRRRTDTIVLSGPSGVAHETGSVIRVPCYDDQALELTHGFIITALSARRSDAETSAPRSGVPNRADSAA